MEKSQYAQEEFLRLLVRLVVEELCKWECSVPIGVSNRHVHLNRADMDTLFGEGSELTRVKDLGQPGQYAAAEVVTSQGSKGELKRMRVLGPLRGESQVEVSIGDGFVLGVHPPVRESGQLEGTPGIKMVGPNGEVEVKRGVIAALRHIHLDLVTAERMGVHDGHRDRKRQQFLTSGPDPFADHELLEVLLYYAVPRKDTNPIAHELINRFGSLQAVFAAPAAELERVPGLGRNAAVLLKLVPELYRKAILSASANETVLNTTDRIGEFFRSKVFKTRPQKPYRFKSPAAYSYWYLKFILLTPSLSLSQQPAAF